MKCLRDRTNPEVTRLLREGGVGVLRTDTIYGLVARADNSQAVERVYEVKSMDADKSPIVLIASIDQLFERITESQQQFLKTVWPGKISVILPSSQAPDWLQRGNASVAYRLPADPELRELLAQTGPLIAPSANPQGESPAISIQQAIDYFGNSVDFYVDSGEVTDKTPSRLVRFHENGHTEYLR